MDEFVFVQVAQLEQELDRKNRALAVLEEKLSCHDDYEEIKRELRYIAFFPTFASSIILEYFISICTILDGLCLNFFFSGLPILIIHFTKTRIMPGVLADYFFLWHSSV